MIIHRTERPHSVREAECAHNSEFLCIMSTQYLIKRDLTKMTNCSEFNGKYKHQGVSSCKTSCELLLLQRTA